MFVSVKSFLAQTFGPSSFGRSKIKTITRIIKVLNAWNRENLSCNEIIHPSGYRRSFRAHRPIWLRKIFVREEGWWVEMLPNN